MITCAVPAGESSTPTSPSVPRATMPLLARTWPAWKLSADVDGAGVPPGNTLTLPADVGPATVMLYEIAFAVAGMEQFPVTGKVRGVPATRGDPGAGLRVSTS